VGKIYAEVFVFGLMGLVHLYILYKKGYLIFQIELQWIKKLLKFGVPLLPHSVSFWLKGGVDKIFITSFCGLQFNGLYSMAISISS
ncbi:MAG: oligosaccharide flippase family protein, partial [Alphaproteobacteria bacterium]|nr:oligosaccharide flippase family protein [Alphaproteobacteria bacterium]